MLLSLARLVKRVAQGQVKETYEGVVGSLSRARVRRRANQTDRDG